MDILILEDEPNAAKRLQRQLNEIDPDIRVSDVLKSVKETRQYFKTGKLPELIISDIELTDGVSFEALKELKESIPVIFTTAYDSYAIQGFKVNGIDYLLKPIAKEELAGAIEKYKTQKSQSPPHEVSMQKLANMLGDMTKNHPSRLTVNYGSKIKMVEFDNIAYFFREGRDLMLCTFDKKHYPVNETLDELEKMADPGKFFRANRQVMVNSKAVYEMVVYSKSRVKVVLYPVHKDPVIVSSEKTPEFKKWMKG